MAGVVRKAAIEALSCCGKNDVDVVPALTAALSEEDEELEEPHGGEDQIRSTKHEVRNKS